MHYFSEEAQCQFVESLLEMIDEKTHVSKCSIQLWNRITHPDTNGPGGPEIDFQIVADKAVVLGECKWTAKIGENQGKHNDKNQLQLRQEYLDKYGKKIFPNIPGK